MFAHQDFYDVLKFLILRLRLKFVRAEGQNSATVQHWCKLYLVLSFVLLIYDFIFIFKAFLIFKVEYKYSILRYKYVFN